MAQPINYAGYLGGSPNIGDMFRIGQAEELARQQMLLQQQQQRQMIEQQQRQAEMFGQAINQVAANPTADGYRQLMLYAPKGMLEGIKESYGAMKTGEQEAERKRGIELFSLLQTGDTAGAKTMVERHIQALDKSGQDTTGYRSLLKTIDENPQRAMISTAMSLGAVDPKLLESTVSALKIPSTTAEATAKAVGEQYKAQAAGSEAQIKAEEAKNAATRIRLENQVKQSGILKDTADIQRMANEYQLKVQELQGKGQDVKVSAFNDKKRGELVENSIIANESVGVMRNLADQFRAAAPQGGSLGTLFKGAAQSAGMDTDLQRLRTELTRNLNKEALQMLPPGPASDKDVAMVKSGFPAENSNPTYVAEWLQAYANVREAQSLRDSLQAEWISAVGHQGPASRDVEVAGVKVPAGTNLGNFLKNYKAEGKSAVTTGPQVVQTGGPSYLKYGR